MSASRERECTGIAASWCPTHGYCSCPRNADGEIVWHWEAGVVAIHGFPAHTETARAVYHYDEECPLHGPESSHADAA